MRFFRAARRSENPEGASSNEVGMIYPPCWNSVH
jgi:hypothetical protein